MPLKTPVFWQDKNWKSFLLFPFSLLYYVGHRIKEVLSNPYNSPLPVICVGGVVAGGSGKTPVVHALVRLIHENKLYQNPVILTRGYGGHMKGPTQVQPGYHDSKDVGDEPLLHAEIAPTIISIDRAAGSRLAEAMGADLIIMDDGLQNNSLRKTMGILVIDAHQGLGNGFMIPAGPLREPLNDAVSKCACIVQTYGHKTLHVNRPVFKTTLNIVSEHNMDQAYFGFAGLGRPEKFERTLKDNGFNLSGFQSFSDHHHYTNKDMAHLKDLAADSILITTEKDYVRLSEQQRDGIDFLKIELSFENEVGMISLLKSVEQK